MFEYILHMNMFCPILRYIRTCDMSEPMFRTKIWWLMSDLMLHMKMCNVLTYNIHAYKMCSVRTYGACEKCYVRTYVTHEIFMLLVQNDVKYDNFICPNILYGWLLTKIWRLLSEHMLHTKMCNVQTHITHGCEMYSVRAYVTYRNVLCPKMCSHENMNTRKYDVLCSK